MNLKNLIDNDITQDEYLKSKNATLFFRNLPTEIGGLIVRKNDINVIIINSYLNEDEKRKAFLHEITHLELNHTYKYKILNDNANIYEQEVDNYISTLNFN